MLKNIISIKNYTVFLSQNSLYKDGKFLMDYTEFKLRAIEEFPHLVESFVIRKTASGGDISRTYAWDSILGELVSSGGIEDIKLKP